MNAPNTPNTPRTGKPLYAFAHQTPQVRFHLSVFRFPFSKHLHHHAHFFLVGQGGVYPMDGDATALLHAAEPGHLALGKLVDGNLQLAEHLVVGQLADAIKGDVLVLQAVADEALGGDGLQERLHLLYHAFLQTGLQAACYLLSSEVAVYLQADGEALALGETDLPQFVGLEHAFYVQACASAHDGHAVARGDVHIGILEGALEFVHVEAVSRFADVNEVVGHLLAVHYVVVQVLAAAYGHASVHHARVGGDYLCIAHGMCQMGGKWCLAAGRGAEDGNQVYGVLAHVCALCLCVLLKRVGAVSADTGYFLQPLQVHELYLASVYGYEFLAGKGREGADGVGSGHVGEVGQVLARHIYR